MSRHLDIACSSVEVQVQIFYFTIIGETVVHIFFGCLFVDVGHEDDPSFDG